MNRPLNLAPRDLPSIAEEMSDRPLAILEHKAEAISIALQARLGIISFQNVNGRVLEAREMMEKAALATDATRSYDSRRTFHEDNGIAVIQVEGTLVHKFGWLDPISGMTGYDGMTRKLRDAMADPDIHGIWLDINSPGGTVAGMHAFIEELALSSASANPNGKPIYAYVNEMACSAAYAVASSCDQIYGPEDAMVGSIGTLAMHFELTKALDEEGVAVTVFRSGERKARGGPYEELDEEFVTKLQDSLDRSRDRFAEFVEMGRPMTLEQIMATEGEWYEGSQAVELGLMDAVLSEADAWGRLEQAAAEYKEANQG